MSGSNGFHPVTNLTERRKCAAAPSKRKYATSEQANAAAEARTKEAGLPIAAYLCASCGSYHLTKSTGRGQRDTQRRQIDGR